MRQLLIAVLLGLGFCGFSGGWAADDHQQLAGQLVKVYQENLAAMQAKDLGRVIATFHPESPSFANAKTAAAQSMVSFDLSYKLTAADLVGVSQDYAVIRVIQETRRIGGDEKFQDNTMDVLQVFKQDKSGNWKLWSSSVLTVTPLK